MSIRQPKVFSGMAFRLRVAFAIVLVLFGVVLAVTQQTFARLAEAERQVSRIDGAKDAGLVVAELVREEYIHQAQMIIDSNRSHLDQYERATRRVREAAGRLQGMSLTASERAEARDVARLVALIDEKFHTDILPALDRADPARLREMHRHTERLVNRVIDTNERFNVALEQRAATAHEAKAAIRRRAAVSVVGCFALAIVVTAGAWFVIGRSLLKRLLELRSGALRLARGNLDTRIAITGSDELSELGTTFNEMAASLGNQQRALVQAQRLSVLGHVAAGVAHEINNPLGVILGYAKLLARGALGRDETSNALRIIEEEARQCQLIVQGLLDVGRPRVAGRSNVNLVDVARDAVERVLETDAAKDRSIVAPTPRADAVTEADPLALRQVLSNLLQNAIEATPSASTVRLFIELDTDFIELVVHDEGAGISKETLEHAFEPFFTTKSTGTGLGLAISQAIATAHGGSLELRSEMGKGTTAHLRLPRIKKLEESRP